MFELLVDYISEYDERAVFSAESVFKRPLTLVPRAHDPFGLRQGSLAQAKRIVGSGEETVGH